MLDREFTEKITDTCYIAGNYDDYLKLMFFITTNKWIEVNYENRI